METGETPLSSQLKLPIENPRGTPGFFRVSVIPRLDRGIQVKVFSFVTARALPEVIQYCHYPYWIPRSSRGMTKDITFTGLLRSARNDREGGRGEQ